MFDHFGAIFCGRLTGDPEVRSTKDGKQMTSFSVAANTKKDHTEFVSVVAFSPESQRASESLSKGSRVTVLGEAETYEGKDGKLRLRMTAVHVFPGTYASSDGDEQSEDQP